MTNRSRITLTILLLAFHNSVFAAILRKEIVVVKMHNVVLLICGTGYIFEFWENIQRQALLAIQDTLLCVFNALLRIKSLRKYSQRVEFQLKHVWFEGKQDLLEFILRVQVC